MSTRELAVCLLSGLLLACGGGGDDVPRGAGGAPPVDLSGCTAREIPYLDDAAYSDTLGRIVYYGGRAVTLLDPTTLETVGVDLPTPRQGRGSLSLSPDGLTAAVGYDDVVAVVDLVALRVLASVTTSASAGDVVMGRNGFAYLLPGSGPTSQADVHSIEVAAAIDHAPDPLGSFAAESLGKLHPTAESLYLVEHSSSGPLGRVEISAGIAGALNRGPFDADSCGDVFISDDGREIVTGCGTVHRSAPGTAEDMSLLGTLAPVPDATPVDADFRSMALDRENDRIYALHDQQYLVGDFRTREATVEVFGYASHERVGGLAIPCLAHSMGKIELSGRHVFAPRGTNQLLVLGTQFTYGIWGIATFERP